LKPPEALALSAVVLESTGNAKRAQASNAPTPASPSGEPHDEAGRVRTINIDWSLSGGSDELYELPA
jgi:hypothetical protein